MEKDNTTIPEVVIEKENVEAKSPESIQKGESTNSINWDEINRQKHYRFPLNIINDFFRIISYL